VGGKPVRRSTGKAVDGLPVSPRADKVRLAEAFEDLKNEYRANGR
jgi:hypothetical protein